MYDIKLQVLCSNFCFFNLIVLSPLRYQSTVYISRSGDSILTLQWPSLTGLDMGNGRVDKFDHDPKMRTTSISDQRFHFN